MSTFNGFEPGEVRVKTFKPTKLSTPGHARVETRKQRQGDRFAFRYTAVCQCGKKFNSRSSALAADYAYGRHIRNLPTAS